MVYEKKKRNIVWLCIDGLRGDSLSSSGNPNVKRHYIDDVASKGAFFPNCIAAAQSTISSSASFFTSLTPEMCRQPTQTANCIPQFHPDAVTIADILKSHGYRTFRWNDMNTYSCHAKSGFDLYEAGYLGLKETPNLSFDAQKRDIFLQKFRECPENKFIYMHLLHLHEYGGESSRVWTGKKYLHHVREVADEVEAIVRKLGLDEDDILMIHSDHGVTLNKDFVEFEARHGGTFAEGRIRVFNIIKCKGIKPEIYPGVVGNIDLAPTLLEMVGIDDMKALGKSLMPVMTEGETRGGPILACWTTKPTHPFHAIGGECPTYLDSICLRDDDWKYTVFQDGRKTLVDLRPEAEDLIDVQADFPAQLEKYEKLYQEMYMDLPETPKELYEKTGQDFSRSDIIPETSLLMPVRTASLSMRKALVSLIDQLGYFEILILDGDESGGVAELVEEYSEDYRIRHIPAHGLELGQMLNKGLTKSRGMYIATISAQYRYTEDYLYILLDVLKSSPSSDFLYADGYQFYQDPRGEDYSYVGPHNFYIGDASNQGSVGSHRFLGSPFGTHLQQYNYVGDVALFTRELIEKVGGFVDSEDSIKPTWVKMEKLTRFKNVSLPLLLCNGLMSRPTFGLPVPLSHPVKVSVILFGDDPSLLRPTFESLKNQSMSEYEIIMAASKDHLPAISAYAKDLPKMDMKLCIVDDAASMNSRCNSLISQARGDYLTWCPAGALLPSTYLEELVSHMDANPDSSFVNASKMLSGNGAKKQIMTAQDTKLKDLWMEPHSLFGVLYRRKLHDEIGIFDGKVGSGTMWDMFMRIIETGLGTPSPSAVLMLPSLYKDNPIKQTEASVVFSQAIRRMGGRIDLGMVNYDLFRESYVDDDLKTVVMRFLEILEAVPLVMESNPPILFNGVFMDIIPKSQPIPPATMDKSAKNILV